MNLEFTPTKFILIYFIFRENSLLSEIEELKSQLKTMTSEFQNYRKFSSNNSSNE